MPVGTQGRTRTGTPVTEVDFESTASTIPPLGPHEAHLTCAKVHVQRNLQVFAPAMSLFYVRVRLSST